MKPNILFVISDDVAQADLDCYGQKLIAAEIDCLGICKDKP
jgi:arylsulfatase A-like enzyme